MLDRRFQMKYTLLLSLTSAALMGIMAALLHFQMDKSEDRLSAEMQRAHDGMQAEMQAASEMVRREMDVSAQQLITRQLPCVAPACPPCGAAAAEIVTEASGSACDVETCRPLCVAMGARPAGGAAPPAGAGVARTGGGPQSTGVAGADPAAGAAVEPPPMAPASGEAEAERRRQRDLIRKIEETVRAETRERAERMEQETRERLDVLDRSTQARLADLRDAHLRGMLWILAAVAAIFVVLLLAGVVVTHKIAGPIYKMKLLMGRIDGDNLSLGGSLRRGDELKDLFDELTAMLGRLRSHQQGEAATLLDLVERLRGAGGDQERSAVVDELVSLQGRMVAAAEPRGDA